MNQHSAHPDEPHLVSRSGWLRAAVLGANDGIVSTSSLVIGVAAASADRGAILLAGLAGLVAGAMSMAAGEYVSVSSQADAEKADIERERRSHEANPEGELHELAKILETRGLTTQTALQAAREMSAHDALGAHIRDDIGISGPLAARPLQAAIASALTFSLAAAIPVATAALSSAAMLLPTVLAVTLLALAALGALGARAGGAPVARGIGRVVFWGCLAMAVTAAAGRLIGVAL